MPHTWIGGEFINALRNLLVYELNGAIIIGHGIGREWLNTADNGISVENMPVYSGLINFEVKGKEDTILVKVSGDAKPEMGFIYKMPAGREAAKAYVNGREIKIINGRDISFKELPCEILISY